MQPRAAGRIARRQLVTGRVDDTNVNAEPACGGFSALDLDARSVRLELPDRRTGRRFELLRECLHGEIDPAAVQKTQHEEVAAEERVPAQPLAQLPEH